MKLVKLENNIGHKFKDKNLLINALTHTSYAFERHTESNEKLEFLFQVNTYTRIFQT